MKLEDEIDALFRLPVAEFTGKRNTLAARLKKEGRANDAERVKLLGKPSVSAWAVNQLYWNHRDDFDELMALGKRFRPAQKPADRRESLDARREVLSNLSDLATELLTEAGHNPSLDTLRRVTTTLEALSTYALLSDGPTPGRLTQDVDPPSFEVLASLMSGTGAAKRSEEPAPRRTKTTNAAEVKRLEEARRAKISAAKVSLQEAKRALSEARARAQSLEAVQKKANIEAREAEQRLEKARAAADDAKQRAKSVAAEVKEVAQTVDAAKRKLDEVTKNLASLLRE